MTTEEITAVGGLFLTFAGIIAGLVGFGKWLIGKILAVIERNSTVLEGLKDNVKANTEVTQENVRVLREHKDVVTDVLTKALRTKRK